MHVSPVGGAAGDGEVGRVRMEDADHRADHDAPVKSHVGLRMHGGSAPLASVLLKGQLPFSLFFLPRTCAQLLCCDPQTVATRPLCPWDSPGRILGRVPFPPPADCPDPGTKPASTVTPLLACRFFTHWATREAPVGLHRQPEHPPQAVVMSEG